MEDEFKEHHASALSKAKPVFNPIPTALVPPIINGPEYIPTDPEELATVPDVIPEEQWNVPGEEVEYIPLFGNENGKR
jgi:hypothetical protein